MRVRLLGDTDRERWNTYVTESEFSSCYHLISWKDIIERSFGHRTYYFMAEDPDERIRGMLPLVHMKSRLFGSFMVSLPYVNYGGICADDDGTYNLLLKSASSKAAEENVSHIEFRHLQQNNGGLPVKTTKVAMQLGLPQHPDELWKTFHAKLRSQIRRPEKEGMFVKSGMDDELDSFYAVFSENMRDLGTPVYSMEFFKNILTMFPESARIFTVYTREGDPAASGFLVGFKQKIEIPWASSLRRYNHYSPNMLLYWSALKFACESGYRLFDFGRSTLGEGTYYFKAQWGAKPVQLYWHYWMKTGERLPQINPQNPKYQMAIKIWRNLPVRLTRLIGPTIVRNIP